MIWIFLSVVLIATLEYPKFRKVVLWGIPVWLFIAMVLTV